MNPVCKFSFNIIIIVIFSSLSMTSALSQPSGTAKSQRLSPYKMNLDEHYGIALGVHYLFHMNSYMRTGWSLGVPYVGLNAGVLIPISSKFKIYPELHANRKVQDNYEGTRTEADLLLFALSAACRYYYVNTEKRQFYISLGSSFNSTYFLTRLYKYDINGTKQGSKGEEYSLNYPGWGLIGGLGFQYRSSDKSVIDFGGSYEWSNSGDQLKGGLGDVGGVKVFIKAIFFI